MSSRAAIFGLEGRELSHSERDFFREAAPWGFILFARNIEGPKQVARLCVALRDAVGREAPVFIDQEGGRVQRFRPPNWRDAPPAAVFGALYQRDADAAKEAVWLNHRLIADELRASGVDADCAPCLDLAIEGADAVIGDRAFGADVDVISTLGRSAMEGLMAGGVAPVIKHVPGHGRADADSHFHLPRVKEDLETLTQTDFAPFKALNDAVMGMTAHIVYDALDPDTPATMSDPAIGHIRREIGFDGLLMTDDLSMKALTGSFAERTERSIRAGCDIVLHCNGQRKEMEPVAEAAPLLAGAALRRAKAAEAARNQGEDFDAEAGLAKLQTLLSGKAA
ncbi:beta-N-acetylhexosaminidase [Hyphobacterium sp.]|uniref:beta-N-acetylhexosaminidase n=1 Tax=Hyphobacterium sp. TaxID=2004662 RepID=UPI003BAA7E44